jgi:hypothetical protein
VQHRFCAGFDQLYHRRRTTAKGVPRPPTTRDASTTGVLQSDLRYLACFGKRDGVKVITLISDAHIFEVERLGGSTS